MKKSFAAWRRHGLLRSQSVVGSNPTDNESCRSSMAEQRHPELLIPAAKNTDVVKVRVTSTKTERFRQLERCGIGKPPVSREASSSKTNADRSFPSERRQDSPREQRQETNRCRRDKSRDGAEESYFVCETTRDCSSATLLDFPPGTNLRKEDEVAGFRACFTSPDRWTW